MIQPCQGRAGNAGEGGPPACGSGIDPYGTWNEQLPAGVQALPSPIPGMNNPGGPCTYGSGNCGRMVYGFMSCAPVSCPKWSSYADYLDWLKGLITSTGSILIGDMGHCYGGDAICIPGKSPQAVGNIKSDNAANVAITGAVAGTVAVAPAAYDAAVVFDAFHPELTENAWDFAWSLFGPEGVPSAGSLGDTAGSILRLFLPW